jgi:hypothetical protein
MVWARGQESFDWSEIRLQKDEKMRGWDAEIVVIGMRWQLLLIKC